MSAKKIQLKFFLIFVLSIMLCLFLSSCSGSSSSSGGSSGGGDTPPAVITSISIINAPEYLDYGEEYQLMTDRPELNIMWDTSNPGSGSFGINPTTQSTDVKHGDNSAAKLETQYAVIKLAAASLYYGRFNDLVGISGAKIDFGQAFASRPVSFKGWYQYAPEVIDNEKQELGSSGVLKVGDSDQCSIYIILSKGTYQVNNTDVSTLLTAETVWKNDQFIAFGELPAEQCKGTDGWVNFDIPLQYKEGKFGEQPTHLIIVCSSSKYGDYFTGAVGSTMYLDDFSLNYEGTPAIWNFESGATEE